MAPRMQLLSNSISSEADWYDTALGTLQSRSRRSAVPPDEAHRPLDQFELPFRELSRKLEALKLAHLEPPKDVDTHPTETRHFNASDAGVQSNAAVCPGLSTTFNSGIQSNQQSGFVQSPDHQQVLANYRTTMLPLLESLLPRRDLQRLIPDPLADPRQQQQQQSSAQLQFLVYAASNNFAGFPAPDLAMMYSFLEEIVHCIPSSSNAISRGFQLLDIPSAKPMAETFFRCAIEAGADIATRKLLLWQDAGISANDQVCDVGGTRCTPVERAAALQHLAVTETLIEFGANVNKSYQRPYTRRRDDENYRHYPCGAIEHAIQGDCRDKGAYMELLSVILRSGGDLSSNHLKSTFSRESPEVVRLLLF